MSQFFGTNPASRRPQGPQRAAWRLGVPKTWRDALGLPADPEDPVETDAAGTPQQHPDQAPPRQAPEPGKA